MFTKSGRKFGAENSVFQIAVRLSAEIHNQMLSRNAVFRWFLARLSFLTIRGADNVYDVEVTVTDAGGLSGMRISSLLDSLA